MEDKVIVTLQGKPIITQKDLEKEKEAMLRANPEMRQAWQGPDSLEMDRAIFDGLVINKIINEYLTSHNVTASDEYQALLKHAYEERKRVLNEKYFLERMVVAVSESEIKDWYETHKDEMLRLSADEQKYIPYEQIRDRIEEQLEQQKRGEAAMKKIEELKKEYDVKINEDLVK